MPVDKDKAMRESYARERYETALRDVEVVLSKARREILTWQRSVKGHSHLVQAYAEKLAELREEVLLAPRDAGVSLLELGLPIND